MSGNLYFYISTGTIMDDAGVQITDQAFSGNDSRPDCNPDRIHGYNNSGTVILPDGTEVLAQKLHKIGPLPIGVYRVGEFGHHDGLGDVVASLTQIAGDGWGRDAFYIHGPGSDYANSSEGCIVVPHAPRVQIAGMAPDTVTVRP